jgi:hypothetical protein
LIVPFSQLSLCSANAGSSTVEIVLHYWASKEQRPRVFVKNNKLECLSLSSLSSLVLCNTNLLGQFASYEEHLVSQVWNGPFFVKKIIVYSYRTLVR